MSEIINQLELDPNTAIVWCGDFNLIFDTYLDADIFKPQLKVNSSSKLLSITEENDLCDIFRVRYPDESVLLGDQRTHLNKGVRAIFLFQTLFKTLLRELK